jgi:DNA-binding beta-propeller fold protein YncE
MRESDLLDNFYIPDSIYNGLLYVDDSLLINRNAIYRHEHLADFRRVFNLNLPWTTEDPKRIYMNSDLNFRYDVETFRFDPFSQTFLATNDKTKMVYQINVVTGKSKTLKANLDKKDKILFPVSTRYIYLETETKKGSEKYLFDLLEQKRLPATLSHDDFLPISDSTYIAWRNIESFTDAGYSVPLILNVGCRPFSLAGRKKLVANGQFLVAQISWDSFAIYDLANKKIQSFFAKSDMCDNKTKFVFTTLNPGWIRDIAISPDGKYVYVSHYNQGIVRYELDTWKELNKYPHSIVR